MALAGRERVGLGAWFLIWALGLCFGACGKYAAPRPPEDFSPREVDALQAAADLQGVQLSWRAPERDMRGRPLKSIEGYWIYRKEIAQLSDIMDVSKPDVLLAVIPDTHLLELDKMRAEAEKAGRLTRRVKVEEEKKRFAYTDLNVQSGKTYLYRIVPFNQGGVAGHYNQLVKVLFRGDSSEIAFIPYRAFVGVSFE